MLKPTTIRRLKDAARGGVGGVLMGLANLVPGISGGTMLLAIGIYPQFIRAVAEVSTLRFRARSLLLLASVVGGAVIAIVAGAGVVKDLVLDHRWIMYSLFIGLTLGGVPLLWRMVRPVCPTVVVASGAGVVVMVLLALAELGDVGAGSGGVHGRLALLVVAGIAGGSAMILPGVSGGYVLLILGQYVVILGAIASARDAVVDRDWVQVAEEMRVFIPVGIGVVIGVAGFSNLVKLCLDRFPRPTLGFLLGLLLGAVVGLWPFQGPAEEGGAPAPDPTPLRLAACLGLVMAGFLASVAVSRLGGDGDDTDEPPIADEQS